MLKGGRMAWSLHCSDSKGSLPWQSNLLSTGTGNQQPSKGASVKQVYSYSLWLKGDARTEGNLDVVQRVHECSCSFLFFFTWVNDMQSLKQTKTKHNKTTRTPNANPCTVSLKAQRKEVGGQSRGTQMLQELTYEIMKPHFQLFLSVKSGWYQLMEEHEI